MKKTYRAIINKADGTFNSFVEQDTIDAAQDLLDENLQAGDEGMIVPVYTKGE